MNLLRLDAKDAIIIKSLYTLIFEWQWCSDLRMSFNFQFHDIRTTHLLELSLKLEFSTCKRCKRNPFCNILNRRGTIRRFNYCYQNHWIPLPKNWVFGVLPKLGVDFQNNALIVQICWQTIGYMYGANPVKNMFDVWSLEKTTAIQTCSKKIIVWVLLTPK